MLRAKLLGFVLLFHLAHCQVFNDRCPPGTYYYQGVCVSSNNPVCPQNMVYKDGACRHVSEPICPPGMIYANGVCLKKNAPACSANSRDCNRPITCQSSRCSYEKTCPDNMILYQGNCVSTNIAQCPAGSRLHKGHCLKQSQPACPPDTYYENGVCVHQNLVPLIEIGPDSCPYGSHLEGRECVLNSNVICPPGSSSKNGTCVADCEGNSFPINGTCAQCPLNSELVNGQCIQCKPGMILRNGRCSCPPKKALLNGECVTIDIHKCSENEFLKDGRCTPYYCLGVKCCKDSWCNSCFDSCQEINNNTKDLSDCQADCLKSITPSIPPSVVDPKKVKERPSQAPLKKRPKVVNINNIVNSTEEKNIVTNVSNGTTTVNNLNLDSAKPHNNKTSTPTKNTNEGPCCVIPDKKKCHKVDGRNLCYHRRRHVCGDECYGTFEVPIDPPRPRPQIPMYPPRRPALVPQQYAVERPQVVPQPFYVQQPFYVPQIVPQPYTYQQPLQLPIYSPQPIQNVYYPYMQPTNQYYNPYSWQNVAKK